jgi:hypothetical protein
MEDVNISKFRAQVVRSGSTPASPGFVVSEGQNPVDPSGSGQNHLPVTIGSPANGLAVTDAQILTIDKAQIFAGTSSQFVKGDGTLDSTAYGTGTVTSVALTMPTAFTVAGSPITTTGTLAVTATGTTAQYIRGDGSLATFPGLTGFVPYTGATADVNLGTHDLAAERGTFTNNGSSDTLTVNHTSGSGYGIIVTKGGSNEALYVSKTSGSGNAMTVVGGRTSLVDLALSSVTNTAGDFLTLSGGVVHKRTAAEVRTDIGAGTVTSVGLSSATSGVTIGSTPVTTSGTITLAIATASGSQNGLLSSTDWTTFNGKQNLLTNPVTGTGTSGQVAYFTGTTAISSDSNLIWDAVNDRLGIGVNAPSERLEVLGPDASGAAVRWRMAGGRKSGYLYSDSAGVGIYDTNLGDAGIYLAQNSQIDFRVNGSQRVLIYSDGNVSISNSPSNAGFKLDVNGRGRFTAGAGQNGLVVNGVNSIFAQNVTAGTGTSTSFGMTISAGTNSSDIAFQIYNSAENAVRLFVRGDGNVGIGTASPAAELQVGKTSDVVIAMSNSSSVTSGNRGGIAWYNSNVSTVANIRAVAVTDNVGTELQFYTRPAAGSLTQIMTITSGGNVLIGTTTSGASKLRIVGLPTSSAGLSAGDVYSLAGTLMIA